jgi:hypothetical protein
VIYHDTNYAFTASLQDETARSSGDFTSEIHGKRLKAVATCGVWEAERKSYEDSETRTSGQAIREKREEHHLERTLLFAHQ